MHILQKRLLVTSLILNVIFGALSGYFIYSKGGMSYLITRTSILTRSKLATSVTDPYYQDRKSLFESLPKTNSSIVFLGDSITDGCEWDELLSNHNIKNRGIGRDNTSGTLNRLDEIIALNPSQIFLMIGINDIGGGRNATDIVSDYDKILGKIHDKLPETKVFVQSVLPVNYEIFSTKLSANSNFKNPDKIIDLNKQIERLSSKYQMRYVDLYTVMATKDGNLKEELTNDGLHLNGKGYKKWGEIIKPYI